MKQFQKQIMMRSGDIFNQNFRREINILIFFVFKNMEVRQISLANENRALFRKTFFLVPWIPEEWGRFLKPAVLPEKLDQNLIVLDVFLLWVSDAGKNC